MYIASVFWHDYTIGTLDGVMLMYAGEYGEYCEAGGATGRGVRCRHGRYVMKQRCRTAFDLCGRARMSRGVQAPVPRSGGRCLREHYARR